MRPLFLLTPLALLAIGLPTACGGSGKPAAAKSASTSTTSASSASRVKETGTNSTSATGTATTSTSTAVTGTAVAPGVVSATAGGITATLHATTHSPRVNAGWPISFTVTKGGQPLQAKVSYEYLFAGNVVAKRSNYTFTGRFHDVFRWPASAVGYPLTFRAVILAGGQTLFLDYPVQVAH